MGKRAAIDFSAFNYGYVSPKLRGRVDLDFFNQSLDYVLNYLVSPQGEASLRQGSIFVSNTRDNAVARLIPFLYNTEQAYIIELTAGFMRFYKDHGLITLTAQAITAVTKANPAVVTYTGSDTYANGDRIIISDVSGMHQLNGREFTVANVNTGANTFELSGINSTTYDTYVSGGTVAEIVEITNTFTVDQLFDVDYTQTNNTMYVVHAAQAPQKLTRSSHTAWTLAIYVRTSDPFGAGPPVNWPSRVTLYEQRLVFAASDANPTRLWFSKAGSLDDFTTGTNAADAMIFTVASDQANRIMWMIGAENYLAFGTTGSEYRVTGNTENDGLTPTNISVKPTSFNGVAGVRPIRLDSYILFVQRNGKTVRSYEYNALQDGYTSPDRTLLADHIGKSKIKQMTFTAGTPNIIWSVRNDGILLGLTFDPGQQVVAWTQHKTQGLYGSVATIPEVEDDDELWQVVTRIVNGQTVRYVEYTPNAPAVPVVEDYFTGEDNKDADEALWLTDMWNMQKTLVHSDAALVYDGRDVASVALTITGTLTAGSVVTVTAGGAFFTSQMATDRRRIQSPEGGQIEITAYTSSTVVTGLVRYDLEAATFSASTWYYMAQGISGLWHLEGMDVQCLADGGIIGGKTVSNGAITLDEDAGYVIVGLGYQGIGKTQSIEPGGENGKAQTKPRVITKLGVQLRSTLGTKFGTSLYNLEHPSYREAGEVAGRPPRLFDGAMPVQIPDQWSENKNLYWLHDTPTPSNIQLIMIHTETNDT